MHIHRLDKIWMIFGIGMLGVFLLVLGVSTFAMGMQPPTGHEHVQLSGDGSHHPDFEPQLKQVGEKEYVADMTAFIFSYGPEKIEIPAGSKVRFNVTSTDVVHGFQIPRTNVNMMVMPGQVNSVEHTFHEPGEYLILCNEYCGASHEFMKATVIVK